MFQSLQERNKPIKLFSLEKITELFLLAIVRSEITLRIPLKFHLKVKY